MDSAVETVASRIERVAAALETIVSRPKAVRKGVRTIVDNAARVAVGRLHTDFAPLTIISGASSVA